MFIGERRRKILAWVDERGRATVSELAAEFGTSTVTIRGDLAALAQAGSVARTYGGALRALPAKSAPQIVVNAEPVVPYAAEKERIGRAACQFIKDGETIIIAAGTTTMAVARGVSERRWQALTVITNALKVAVALYEQPGIRVLVLGGMVHRKACSLAGDDAEQALAQLSADRLFLGVEGLDPQVGITTRDTQQAALNKLMVKVARQTIAVLDSSKLGRRTLSVIVPIRELDAVVTDSGASREAIEALETNGLRLITV